MEKTMHCLLSNVASWSLDTKKSAMCVNGNNLFCAIDDGDLNDDKKREIFDGNVQVDSIIGFTPTHQENMYDFAVYEKDGSVSEFCGNGAIAVYKILRDSLGLNDIVLRTRSGFESRVFSENGQIFVEMDIKRSIDDLKQLGVVSNAVDTMEEFRRVFTPSEILKYFTKNQHDLYKFFPDGSELSNYDTYFSQVLDNLSHDDDFKQFVKDCAIGDVGAANGEPHIVIEIPYRKNEFLKEYYFTGLSFLLRYAWKDGARVCPDSINIMFVENHNDVYKIYPSERGVCHGIHYDKTGACGTGTTVAGNHIMEQNQKDNIAITSRSGTEIIIQKRGNDVYLVGKEEDIVSGETVVNNDMKTSPLFSLDAFQERVLYMMNRGKPDEDMQKNIRHYIEEQLGDVGISAIKGVYDAMGGMVGNSCWHETEFPIDPYKVVSVLNQYGLANTFDLDPHLTYLDTQNSAPKDYPNIALEKNAPKIIVKIPELLQNHTDFSAFKKEFKKMYEGFMFDSAFGEDRFYQYLQPLMTHANKQEQKTLKVVYEKVITPNLYKKIYKSLLVNFEKHWEYLQKNPHNQARMAQKFFQDFVLQEVFDGLSVQYADIYTNQKHSLPPIQEIPLYSQDMDFQSKLCESIYMFLHDKEFGADFFDIYINEVLESREGRAFMIGEVLYHGEKKKIIIDNDMGLVKYYIGTEEVTKDVFVELFSDSSQFSGIQGSIYLLFSMLAGNLQLGSERGYRDIVMKSINTYREKYPERDHSKKLDQFAQNIIKNFELNMDYDPEKDFYENFPAGTDHTSTKDLFLSVLLGKGHIGREFDDFLKDYLVPKRELTKEEVSVSVSESVLPYIHRKKEKLQEVMIQYDPLENIELYRNIKDRIDFLDSQLLKMKHGETIMEHMLITTHIVAEDIHQLKNVLDTIDALEQELNHATESYTPIQYEYKKYQDMMAKYDHYDDICVRMEKQGKAVDGIRGQLNMMDETDPGRRKLEGQLRGMTGGLEGTQKRHNKTKQEIEKMEGEYGGKESIGEHYNNIKEKYDALDMDAYNTMQSKYQKAKRVLDEYHYITKKIYDSNVFY